MRVLSRTWQMLLKGIAEVQSAARPVAAAEMVLVRIAYAADLPAPDEIVRSLREGAPASERVAGNGGTASAADATASRPDAPRAGMRATSSAAINPVARAASPSQEPAGLTLGRFEDIVALATEKRDLQIKTALERDVRLVHCEDGRLEIALEPGASKTLLNELSRKLQLWSGRQWMVVVSRETGNPTLRAQAEAREAELKSGVRADPLVQAVLERFPGAEIVAVRPPEGTEQSPIADGNSDNDED